MEVPIDKKWAAEADGTLSKIMVMVELLVMIGVR